jgi:hypothetical protein
LKITIEVDREQAQVIMNALEFYSRMCMGQFDQIHHNIHAYRTFSNPEIDISHICLLEDALKSAMFPGISRSAYICITSSEVGERAQTSWDIYQTLRHAISWVEYPEGHFPEVKIQTVNFDKPTHVNFKRPLPKVTIEKSDGVDGGDNNVTDSCDR